MNIRKLTLEDANVGARYSVRFDHFALNSAEPDVVKILFDDSLRTLRNDRNSGTVYTADTLPIVRYIGHHSDTKVTRIGSDIVVSGEFDPISNGSE